MTPYTNLFLDQLYLIKKKKPWSLSSHHAMMAISFTAYNKQYDHEVFKSIKKQFQQKGGWGNMFTASSDELIYCFMMLKLNEPLESIEEILALRKQIKQVGFYQSSHLTYCGYSILDKDPQERYRIMTRAFSLYKSLKKRHPFITTSNEIPLLFMLAESKEGESKLLENYETLYSELIDAGFTKSNALQSAALTLTLLPLNTREVVEQCLTVKSFLSENKMPTPKEIYILLPLMIYYQLMHPADLSAILDIQNELKKLKSVKWFSRVEKLLLATCLKSIEKSNLNRIQSNSEEAINQGRVLEIISYIHFMNAAQQAASVAMVGVYS